jgi:hypothetical protein
LILIIEEALPDKFISKLRIRSTESIIDLSISLKLTGFFCPLIFAEVEVNGESISLIIFFKKSSGVTLKAISLRSFDR